MLRSVGLYIVKASLVLSVLGATANGCFWRWHHRHYRALAGSDDGMRVVQSSTRLLDAQAGRLASAGG